MKTTVTEIAQFERDGLDVGSLDLHLEEARSLLGLLQRAMGYDCLGDGGSWDSRFLPSRF